MDCDKDKNEYKDGDVCKICPMYTYPNEAGDGCISDLCGGNQYLRFNGKCEYCAAFK